MRFSSDQELFEQNSNNQSQQKSNIKSSHKKKQKKQTMLSKFLHSLNQNTLTKLHNYQKLKRPIFQRRTQIPQKLTLYEDILFILTFKQNQSKILSDTKQIKTICLDLESRTKRKQCTIKERIQKKLCKMTPQELLSHVANDKDISFNLKKVLTSGSKAESERTINKSQIQVPSIKDKQQVNMTPVKQELMNAQSLIIEEKNNDNLQIKQENSKTKEGNCHSIEKQTEIKQQENQKSLNQQFNDNQIIIVYKKNVPQGNSFMFNKTAIQKEIKEIKIKEQQVQQRQALMKQLQIQMDIIMHFKNKTSFIFPQIKALILQAQKIMKILDINTLPSIQKQQALNQQIVEEKNQSNKIHQQTADKSAQLTQNSQLIQNTDKKPLVEQNKEISEFKIPEEGNNQNKQSEKNETKYTIQYALCNNDEYIKLYNSNPQVFEPLLWTEEEDKLIDRLIEKFKQNEKLFSLLVRYKGPEWFIERCIFLQKKLQNIELNEAIRAYKPLNLSRLNGHLIIQKENVTINGQNCILNERINEMEMITDVI